MDLNDANVKKDPESKKKGDEATIRFNTITYLMVAVGVAVVLSLIFKEEPKSNTVVSPPVVQQTATAPTTPAKTQEQPAAAPTFKIGDTVSAGKFDVVVAEYKADSQFKTSYSVEKTENQFVIVKVKVTNKDERARDISNNMFQLVDNSGKTYDAYDRTIVDDSFLIYETVNPGISRTRSIVFETPKDIPVSKLRINSGVALAGGQYVDIDLNSK